MNKNIINKCFLGLASISFAAGAISCNDMLDTKPQGQFTSNQVGEEQALSFVTSAYAGLINHFFDNNNLAFSGPITNWVFDVRSDDAVKGGGALNMEEGIHMIEIGNIQNDNAVLNDKWTNLYYAIARCNSAIKAISEAGAISQESKETYFAEMRTLRAYFYFDLLRIFNKFPYFDETTPDPSSVPAGNISRLEIVNILKADLRNAYNTLPASQNQPGRFNKYVAAALLARIDMFTAGVPNLTENAATDWKEVETYTDYVISSGKYQLYPNFLDMSKIEFNNQYESIMAIQFSSSNNTWEYNWSNLLNCTYSLGNLYGTGDDFFLGSQSLANAFMTDNDGLPYLDGYKGNEIVGRMDGGQVAFPVYTGNVDPRLDFTLGRIGMPWRSYLYSYDDETEEGWCRAYNLYGQFSGKKPYPSPDSEFVLSIFPWGQSPLNFCLIRYADVLLMKAEALIEQNSNLDEARNLVNQVRAKAARSVDANYAPIDIDPSKQNYMVGQYPSTVWNQDYARKAVRMERRLELAMEGLRWFDLVRWGNTADVMNQYYQKESQYHTYYSGASMTDSNIFLPIPLNQVDNSNGLYSNN